MLISTTRKILHHKCGGEKNKTERRAIVVAVLLYSAFLAINVYSTRSICFFFSLSFF